MLPVHHACHALSRLRRVCTPLLGAFGRALYPRACPACGEGARVHPAEGTACFCPACREALVPAPAEACSRCGISPDLFIPAGRGPHLCRPCRERPPPWRRARGYWLYGGPLQDAIVAWKNQPAFHLSEPLAALYVVGVQADARLTSSRFDRIVPIPSHPRALARRGFNPAGVLAEALWRAEAARESAAPTFRPDALRVSRGAPDLGTRGKGRRARLRRSPDDFQVDRRAVAGARIWLVDDVMTTGATVTAATEALLAAGARLVEVGTLARVDRGAGGSPR